MIRLDHINISFGDKSVIENAALTQTPVLPEA